MKHYCDEWIKDWCQENGWTDLCIERHSNYWAFPPGAVMPEPIPDKILRLIKTEKGLTRDEKVWSLTAAIALLLALIISYVLKCPMPFVLAFAFAAIVAGKLEVE